MINPLDPDRMTADERLEEVAGILAAGFLRLRSHHGHILDALPDSPEPAPVVPQTEPKEAAGILRN